MHTSTTKAQLSKSSIVAATYERDPDLLEWSSAAAATKAASGMACLLSPAQHPIKIGNTVTETSGRYAHSYAPDKADMCNYPATGVSADYVAREP